jgi:hypothetical protein
MIFSEAIELLKETIILYAAWSELVDRIAEIFHIAKTWGKLFAGVAAIIVFIHTIVSKKPVTNSAESQKVYRYGPLSRVVACIYTFLAFAACLAALYQIIQGPSIVDFNAYAASTPSSAWHIIADNHPEDESLKQYAVPIQVDLIPGAKSLWVGIQCQKGFSLVEARPESQDKNRPVPREEEPKRINSDPARWWFPVYRKDRNWTILATVKKDPNVQTFPSQPPLDGTIYFLQRSN